MGLRAFLVSTCLLGLVAACLVPEYELGYQLRIKNVGDEILRDVSVSFDDYVSPGNALFPGKSILEIDVRHPIPHTAIVKWTVDGSDEVEQEMPVKSVVGSDFKGRLNFEIDGEEVRLVASKPPGRSAREGLAP